MNIKKFSRLILIEQTLFTLPFAYIGILFADKAPLQVWLWVTIALASARTAGMSFNRILDADIDSKNPRTKDRLIPGGKVKKVSVWIMGIISSAILILASYMLNPLCFYLSFAAIFFLFTYSFFKRFSSSTHFYLGFIEAAAPIGGYIAVTGKLTLIPFLLGISIMTWIAGLDIVYALQDMEFDEKEKLYSLPVSIGKQKSILVSSICYLISIIALAAAGLLTGMSLPFWISFVLTGLIYIYQQTLARKKDIQQAIKRYFKVNMLISPILFIGTFINVYVFIK